jgi:hypothetical protein
MQLAAFTSLGYRECKPVANSRVLKRFPSFVLLNFIKKITIFRHFFTFSAIKIYLFQLTLHFFNRSVKSEAALPVETTKIFTTKLTS